MELRFNIDEHLIDGLQERTNTTRASDLGRDAFCMLNWATKQVCHGRDVVAVGEDGQIYTLTMDVLDRVEHNRGAGDA